MDDFVLLGKAEKFSQTIHQGESISNRNTEESTMMKTLAERKRERRGEGRPRNERRRRVMREGGRRKVNLMKD